MTRDEKIYAQLETIEESTTEIRRLLDWEAKPPDPEPDDDPEPDEPAVEILNPWPWSPMEEERGLSLAEEIPDGTYSRFELSFDYKHGGWVDGAKRLELFWAAIGGNRKQLGFCAYARDRKLRMTWGSEGGGLSAPYDGKNLAERQPFKFAEGQTYRIAYSLDSYAALYVGGDVKVAEPSGVGPIFANNRDTLRLHFSYDTPYPEEPPGWSSEWSNIRAALYQ